MACRAQFSMGLISSMDSFAEVPGHGWLPVFFLMVLHGAVSLLRSTSTLLKFSDLRFFRIADILLRDNSWSRHVPYLSSWGACPSVALLLLFMSIWSNVRVGQDCFLGPPDAIEDWTPSEIIDALRFNEEVTEDVRASFCDEEFTSDAAFLSAISLAASSLFKIHINHSHYHVQQEEQGKNVNIHTIRLTLWYFGDKEAININEAMKK